MKKLLFFFVLTIFIEDFSDGSCDKIPEVPNIDGVCNNENNPMWGAANVPFRRMCEKLVTGCANSGRPAAQDVCDSVFTLDSDDLNDGSYSAFLTFFGQFLDHDFTLTTHPERDCLNGNDTLDVCNVDACNKGDQCRIVRTVEAQQCFKFTRSLRDESEEQRNGITAFIDLSNVYGSTIPKSVLLRSGVDGKLNAAKSTAGCDTPPADEKDPNKFFAGDVRANENPILTSFHTLFLLEHNKVADELKEIFSTHCQNDDQMDNIIFEVARRINIAQTQRIVINEYLNELGIDIGNIVYKDNVDPSIFQEFSTAGYRFGHSGVKNKLTFRINGDLVEESLQDLFDNTEPLKQNCIDGILEPQWDIRAEKIDLIFAKSIGQKLFIPTSSTAFQSLCALNVQRGRDHGLGTYPCMLRECRDEIDSLPNNLDTLERLVKEGILTQENSDKLQDVYGNDLTKYDLFVAGLAETPLPGSPLGPLFHCILKKQFRHLIRGDRFHVDHCKNFDGKSDKEDTDCGKVVSDINTRLMSHILCRNMNLDTIPQYVFKNPVGRTNNVTCNAVNKLTRLDLWLKSSPKCNPN